MAFPGFRLAPLSGHHNKNTHQEHLKNHCGKTPSYEAAVCSPGRWLLDSRAQGWTRPSEDKP